MKTGAKPKSELATQKFSNAEIISDKDLKEVAKRVAVELEEITRKKQVDYEKLKAVVKL
jgi:hypothetical protein